MGTIELVFMAALPIVIWLEHRHPRQQHDRALSRDNAVSAFLLGSKSVAGYATAALYVALRTDVTPILDVGASLSFLPEAFFALVVLDLKQYWLHQAQHRLNWYYEFHKVHHATPRLNWIALGRTHPFDYVFAQQASDLALILAFGIGFDAYVAGPRLVSALVAGLWSHMNYDYPKVGRPLPWFARIIATPNVHAEHHRLDATQPRNLAEVFVLWDRLFGTFAPPAATPRQFGVEPGELPTSLWGQMVQPVERLFRARSAPKPVGSA